MVSVQVIMPGSEDGGGKGAKAQTGAFRSPLSCVTSEDDIVKLYKSKFEHSLKIISNGRGKETESQVVDKENVNPHTKGYGRGCGNIRSNESDKYEQHNSFGGDPMGVLQKFNRKERTDSNTGNEKRAMYKHDEDLQHRTEGQFSDATTYKNLRSGVNEATSNHNMNGDAINKGKGAAKNSNQPTTTGNDVTKHSGKHDSNQNTNSRKEFKYMYRVQAKCLISKTESSAINIYPRFRKLVRKLLEKEGVEILPFENEGAPSIKAVKDIPKKEEDFCTYCFDQHVTKAGNVLYFSFHLSSTNTSFFNIKGSMMNWLIHEKMWMHKTLLKTGKIELVIGWVTNTSPVITNRESVKK